MIEIWSDSAVDIPLGPWRSVALKSDGTVWTWGDNASLQLGAGASGPSSRSVAGQVVDPADPTGFLTGITAIVTRSAATGASHVVALKSDGTVRAWGGNGNGQLGDGLAESASGVPVVVNGLGGVGAIAAAGGASFALRSDGQPGSTLWAWGSDTSGLLGDGGRADRSVPVLVLTGVAQVAGNAAQAHVILEDGHVWSWGDDTFGDVGDGTTAIRETPVIVDGLTDVLSVDAGDQHTLAVRGDGTVWGFGRNDHSQLTTSAASPALTPTRISGFSLFGDSWLLSDTDGDGLDNLAEYRYGTDPLNADSNGDGIPDGTEVTLGMSPTNSDADGDGLDNWTERRIGTDPFNADTDGDGYCDGTGPGCHGMSPDCFPLDAARWQCPASDPNDHTPPVITLSEPASAVLINSVP